MESGNDLAPIVLFVYNRPWHTRQTLEALQKNDLANESTLFIYADGPKVDTSIEDLEKIQEVRTILKEQQWCKRVEIIYSEQNKGLADSIISGVTEIVNRFGKIIVLEDDIVTARGFLRYMNDALKIYAADDRVMHVSGYMYPVECLLPDFFTLPPTTCWGWATWQKSWLTFKKDPIKQYKQISKKNKGWKKFTLNYSITDFKYHLEQNISNKINTWAIFWYASVYLNNGLSLHPRYSFTKNIGFDNSGEHCDSKNSSLDTSLFESEKLLLRMNLNIKLTKSEYKKLYQELSILFNSKPHLTFRDKFYLLRKNLLKWK